MLERPLGSNRTKEQSSMTEDQDCSLRRAMARLVYRAAFLESAMMLYLKSVSRRDRGAIVGRGLRLRVEGFSCGVVAFLEVAVPLRFEV